MNDLSLRINIFSGIEEKTEKLRFILVLLLTFSLPFDIFYSSILLITLLLTTLIDINKSKIMRIPKEVWIFQLIYFLGLIGYFYSYHKPAAGFLLERQLAIFLLPLILPVAVQINRQKVQMILATLAFSCLLTITYLFLYMIYNIKADLNLPLLETVLSGVFF